MKKTPDEPVAVATAPPSTPTARRRFDLGAVALVVALGVGAAGVYWERVVMLPDNAALAARVEALAGERDGLVARVNDAEAHAREVLETGRQLKERVDALGQANATLEQTVKSLASKGSESELRWVLAEVEYLVLAAGQRIALEHDAKSARAALAAADQRLAAAALPGLTPLRERLAADLQALDAAAQADIEGLALALAAQAAEVDTLPTKPIANVDTSFAHSSQQAVTPDNWREVLRAMWADLVSLVEIKDADLPDDVLFDPKLRYFLEQNLKLELASARLALLNRDTANFRAAVDAILTQLDRYYDAGEGRVAAMRAKLVEARALDLAPPLPDLSATLEALRAARETLDTPP
ncbi:MAG: uroporphyrinogen-III C-methyltransferase [Gammaproteobacteria bacterium]|nr:uroporphyrinogen-III C-methyltransferase [Gammaproteobacteria bacterium]